MDTDAFTVGDVEYLGQVFLELRRPGEVEGVRSGRDDEIGVLEGLKLYGLVAERQGH